MDDYSKIWEIKRNDILYARFRLNGRQLQERIGEVKLLTRGAINKRKKDIQERLARGEYIERKILFEKMAEEFLRYALNNRTPRTYLTTTGHIRKLTDFFKGYLLTKITSFMVEGYMKHRREENPNLSDKTIINELFTLSAIFRRAIKLGYLKDNPIKEIEFPKYSRPEMKFFIPKELETIFAGCSRYLRPILLIGITTGFRSSEICSIKWENIDFEQNIINIICDETFKTKNKKNKIALMLPSLKEELIFLKQNWIDYMTDNVMPRQQHQMNYVFCHYSGERIKSFSNAFEKLMKKIGIEKATPHTMRHTFDVLFGNFSKNPMLTSKLMGHSDLRMTQSYYHLELESARESCKPFETLIKHCLTVDQSLTGGGEPTVYLEVAKN